MTDNITCYSVIAIIFFCLGWMWCTLHPQDCDAEVCAEHSLPGEPYDLHGRDACFCPDGQGDYTNIYWTR